MGRPLRQNLVQRRLACIFNRPQPKADEMPLTCILYRKIKRGGIDVRRGHINTQCLRLRKVTAHLIRIVPFHREHRRQVLHRVMRLQKRRLAGHFGIVGRMGAIKTVPGKKLNIPPNPLAHLP